MSSFEKLAVLYSVNYGTCPGLRDPFLPLFKNIQLIYHPHQLIPAEKSALIIWGGEDISPQLYNHQPISNSGPSIPTYRDQAEQALAIKAIENNMPVIGICRGAQLLCAVAGGSLIQHVTGHNKNHFMVDLKTGNVIPTNSYHHQMMNPFKTQYTLIANTLTPQSRVYEVDPAHPLPPGVRIEPEIIYFQDINGLAIQGHPEFKGPDGFYEYILQVTERFLHVPSSL